MSRLDDIVSVVRSKLERRMVEQPVAWHERRAREQPDPRPLAPALRRPGKGGEGAAPLRVIAELKRRSPSAGDIRPGLQPVRAARELEAAGAAALSVLTEPDFFGGSLEFLAQVRAAVGLPLLRKDFLLHPYQVVEARAHGADAILLLAAVLDDDELLALRAAAVEWGMEALCEAHGEVELERLLALDLPVIGLNARDLGSFEVDLPRALGWASRVGGDRVLVAESGVREPADAARVAAAPVDACLCGEGLMRGGSVGERFLELFGPRP